MDLSGITVIEGTAAAGVYAVGNSGDSWHVYKSTNGGSSFALVDQFRYDPTRSGDAWFVTGDAAGNVYVGGYAGAAVITGYARNGRPIYGTRVHWIVRKSLGGNSGSWATVDDYLPAGNISANPFAMGTDLAGNVYVAGTTRPASGIAHAIIRTNAGGSWSTSDDFTGRGGEWTYYSGLAVDSAGTLYAGGAYGDAAPPTFIRSMAGALPPSAPASGFSSTSIAQDDDDAFATDSDDLLALVM
jgi:hypothetical protein